jgi:hypothetical protein
MPAGGTSARQVIHAVRRFGREHVERTVALHEGDQTPVRAKVERPPAIPKVKAEDRFSLGQVPELVVSGGFPGDDEQASRTEFAMSRLADLGEIGNLRIVGNTMD